MCGIGDRCGVAVSRASNICRIGQGAARRRAGGPAVCQGPRRSLELSVVVGDGSGKDRLAPSRNRGGRCLERKGCRLLSDVATREQGKQSTY